MSLLEKYFPTFCIVFLVLVLGFLCYQAPSLILLVFLILNVLMLG